MKVLGRFKGTLTRANGTKKVIKGKNLIVAAGVSLVATRMVDNGNNAPSHMAIGTSAAVTTSTMTALQSTEVERQQVQASSINGTVTYIATFGNILGSLTTIREYGIFNEPTNGTMFARFLSSDVELSPGDSYMVEWSITFEEETE